MDIKLPGGWIEVAEGTTACYEEVIGIGVLLAKNTTYVKGWSTLLIQLPTGKCYARRRGPDSVKTPEFDTPEAAIAYWEMLYG